MKRILLFILPILLIVAIGFTIFGVMQIRFTQDRLMDDLKKKAKAIDETLEFSARGVIINNDLKSANRLVESFQKRERLQGCVIYDKDGNILAITERISDWKEKEKPYLLDVLADKTPRGSLEQFRDSSVYSYILPVMDEENNIIGMVEVIYDTSYVFTTLTDLWRRLSISLITLLVVIVFIMFLIQRQIFILPVLRLTEWFKHFQMGETDEFHPIKEKGELGNLASEVEQVALSLRVARKVVTEKATERVKKEELWSQEKLKDLIHARLGENALFVVSNREPYMHMIDENTNVTSCIRPASGVVTAIDPVMRACGGTWIAHGAGNADKNFVNSKDKLGVPPDDIHYILKRVWLSKEEEEGYYYGFSNEGLWPLCHLTHTRPLFRDTDWKMYIKVNQRFANNILEELPAKAPFVFIQDYHFTLLPKMLKERRPDATVALFWHIPWPTPESFSTCPYQNDILEGMLACDLIGFHVQSHCNNFLDTANRLLESRVDTERFSVIRRDKETFVRAFPISVDGYFTGKEAEVGQIEIDRLKKEYKLEGKFVALGVDRIDYTKGIPERMLAVERFLEKYPEHKGRFVLLQLSAPSRVHIKRYHDLISEIDELVEKINWKYKDGSWKPIIYLKRHFSPDEIKPFYALSDMCIVSSLHDGMNLVAKEYVAAKNDLKGILVLSRFTGASRELQDAVLINPYATEEFAERIREAVEMPAEEKKKRMDNMRKIISENNVYRWAGNIITELTALRKT